MYLSIADEKSRFSFKTLYLKGQLEGLGTARLLPVTHRAQCAVGTVMLLTCIVTTPGGWYIWVTTCLSSEVMLVFTMLK